MKQDNPRNAWNAQYGRLTWIIHDKRGVGAKLLTSLNSDEDANFLIFLH